MNILICDDDKEIAEAISIYLQNEGYATLQAHDGRQALSILEQYEIHLIIMDVMMPEMDGLRATMEIRKDRNIPIIMLSAKSEGTDKILGLNMGADDYVTKPFNPVELLARVRSALRRYASLGGMKETSGNGTENGIYRTGGLIIDDNKKSVTVDGADVSLTAMEYNILRLLASEPDRVFTSSQIYEAVWDEPAFYVSKTVSVHIRHIREKIEINPKEPRYLKVVYGLGYKVVKIK